MNRKTMTRQGSTMRRTSTIVLAAVGAFMTSSAMAQHGNPGGSGNGRDGAGSPSGLGGVSPGGGQAPAAPRTGSGGIAAPSPRSGLGGVVPSIPNTYAPVTRTSPSGGFRPQRVGPFPGVPVVPPNVDGRPGRTGGPIIDPRLDGRGGRGGSIFGDGVDGSGLNINGNFRDDNFRLGFHVGSGYPAFGDRYPWYRRHYPYFPVAVGYYGWGWPYYSGYNGSYYYDGSNRYGLIGGIYTPSEPQAAPTPPQPPMSESGQPADDKQLGDFYLQNGDSKAASTAYRRFLDKHADDPATTRALGLALLDEGQVKEAVAVIARAYQLDPNLATTPIVADVYGTDTDLRSNLRRASIYANQSHTASAWLTVAALMQAEGRSSLAHSMLDRARAAGLEPSVFSKMDSVLRL